MRNKDLKEMQGELDLKKALYEYASKHGMTSVRLVFFNYNDETTEKYFTFKNEDGFLFSGNTTNKVCKKCKRLLSVMCFNKDINRPDGLSFYCSECNKTTLKQFYKNEKNREKKNEYNKAYQIQYREKRKERIG